MFTANRLIDHADHSSLIPEVRFALAAFAYVLLYEGAIDEAHDRLKSFAIAGHESAANLATIANVETERMSERIRSGPSRAKAEGKRETEGRLPVSPAEIAQERAADASWGSSASKYSLPRTSVRRLYQKGLTENDGGHGRDGCPVSRSAIT